MFAAGRQSPWWLSGISSYMTMFSAGTFVVWGGMAYDYGFVAISISLCYGVAAFLAGMFFAAKWRRMGLSTAAEFIELRFGKVAFHFYTWWKLLISFTTGLTLYGLGVMLCPLIPLSPDNPFVNPATGVLSIDWACMILGGIVIIYTMCGGLWAVLLTSTMQFFVLLLAVVMVVPLSFAKVGGFQSFVSNAPEGFFAPTHSPFTWLFLVGWMLATMFQLGGEWVFIQRYFCVPTQKDAKKSCYIFGVLYLTTPFLWMLPPMIYRVINPNADPQEAYILICKEVLPAGMIGLMIAAMFSATASSISSQLNVNASVLTNDIYTKLFRPNASQKHIVQVGKVLTVILGVWIVGGALIMPRLTSYRNFTIVFGSVIGSSVLMPTVWAIWSKRIGRSSVWLTLISSIAAFFVLKVLLSKGGLLSNFESFVPVVDYIDAHSRTIDVAAGIIVPLIILFICEIAGAKQSPDYTRLQQEIKLRQSEELVTTASTMPARVMIWNLAALAVILIVTALIGSDRSYILWVSSAVLLLFAGVLLLTLRRVKV